MARVWLTWALLAGFATGLAGCGKAKQPWEIVYPVKGVVNYQGQPVAGALITLFPENAEFPGSIRPRATSKEDGTFEIGTYSKADGAPAGGYKAVVKHHPVVGSKDYPVAGPNDLPEKYSTPETTDLTVQVQQRETDLGPLELN